MSNQKTNWGLGHNNDQELSNDPFQGTVIGTESDPFAHDLFSACQKYPLAYRQTEWLDRKKGPLPNQNVDYPELEKSAVFICTGDTCSSPKYTVQDVEQIISKGNKIHEN
jgi:uncharacterized protein